jgi:hypothetical protein
VYRFPIYSLRVLPGNSPPPSPLSLFWLFYNDFTIDMLMPQEGWTINGVRPLMTMDMSERMAVLDWLNDSGKPWHLEYDIVPMPGAFVRVPGEQKVTYYFVLPDKGDAALFKLFTNMFEERVPLPGL